LNLNLTNFKAWKCRTINLSDAGFIGSILIDRLLYIGYKMTGIDYFDDILYGIEKREICQKLYVHGQDHKIK
jgi:hypothetical protein